MEVRFRGCVPVCIAGAPELAGDKALAPEVLAREPPDCGTGRCPPDWDVRPGSSAGRLPWPGRAPMILPLALFAQLAAACGSLVHVDTLAAVARTESRFNPLAIGDTTTGRTHSPATPAEAVATATALLAQGHSLDLGLMQVNSANLPGLGLTIADAFDPCRSIAAGARVLADGYERAPEEDAQRALVRALSRYNTGSPVRGVANGYVAKVQASAAELVPAIRVDGARNAEAVLHGARPLVAGSPPEPPAWDVYARARHARNREAAVLRPSPVLNEPSPSPPVQPAIAPAPAEGER